MVGPDLSTLARRALGRMLRPVFNAKRFRADIVQPQEEDTAAWRRVFAKPPAERTPEDLDFCEATLAHKVEFFHELPTAQRRELFRTVDMVTLDYGDVLFDQGDIGDAYFVILQGMVNINVEVAKTSKIEDLHRITDAIGLGNSWESLSHPTGLSTINTLGPMQCFGEMALQSKDARRMAQVAAAENCTLLSVTAESYHRVQAEYQRAVAIQCAEMLAETPYFRNCPRHIIEGLAGTAKREVFAPGEEIIAQGTLPYAVALLAMGSVRVERRLKLPASLVKDIDAVTQTLEGRGKLVHASKSHKVHVCTLEKGELFGHEGLLNSHERTRFTMIAETRARVFRFTKREVQDVFAKDTEAWAAARKLCAIRFPSDESLVRRLVRGHNWKLFKVKLSQELCERNPMGAAELEIAKSAIDFATTALDDEEALDFRDNFDAGVASDVTLFSPEDAELVGAATASLPSLPIHDRAHDRSRMIRSYTGPLPRGWLKPTKEERQRMERERERESTAEAAQTPLARALLKATGHMAMVQRLKGATSAPANGTAKQTPSAGMASGTQQPQTAAERKKMLLGKLRSAKSMVGVLGAAAEKQRKRDADRAAGKVATMTQADWNRKRAARGPEPKGVAYYRAQARASAVRKAGETRRSSATPGKITATSLPMRNIRKLAGVDRVQAVERMRRSSMAFGVAAGNRRSRTNAVMVRQGKGKLLDKPLMLRGIDRSAHATRVAFRSLMTDPTRDGDLDLSTFEPARFGHSGAPTASPAIRSIGLGRHMLADLVDVNAKIGSMDDDDDGALIDNLGVDPKTEYDLFKDVTDDDGPGPSGRKGWGSTAARNAREAAAEALRPKRDAVDVTAV